MENFGFEKIACASPVIKVGNPRFNSEMLCEVIEKAHKGGAKVLLTPELSLCGYTCADLFFSQSLKKACEEALKSLVEYSADMDIAVIVGMPVYTDIKVYNAAVVFHKGKILGAVPKEYIANYSEFYEKRWFASGAGVNSDSITLCGQSVPFGRLLFKLGPNIIAGIEICEDLWVTIPPSSYMALQGANLILNPSASNEMVTKSNYREGLVSSQSARCICAYAYSGAGVYESTTDVVFSGSTLVAENGIMLARGERFSRKNIVTFATIDTQKLNVQRQMNVSFTDNASRIKNESYTTVYAPLGSTDIKDFDRMVDSYPFVPSDKDKRNERCREIFNIQSSGLAKRLEHTGLNKCILGISGGLDSTLALLVTVKAIKEIGASSENITGVTMPGFGTTGRTYDNANKLMRALGVTIKEIDIKPACLLHMKDIEHDISVHDITYENTQARERTQILMDLANKHGALLVGTGDLSELAMGWCTYNGDHMSMYGVNSGVPKTLVRHLVENVAIQLGGEISEILYDILDTPVSPELLPPDKDGKIAQKTEDNIGPYELHDFFLYYFIRHGASKEKILFLAKHAFNGIYTEETIKRWLDKFLHRFFASQFKRSCLPDGPKVGSVSLSPRGDWRMPSDADGTVWF